MEVGNTITTKELNKLLSEAPYGGQKWTENDKEYAKAKQLVFEKKGPKWACISVTGLITQKALGVPKNLRGFKWSR